MLGGLAPLILFRFGQLPSAAFGPPPILQDIVQLPLNVGTPFPIYLDEGITQIYVENETRNLDLETDVFTRVVQAGPQIRQKGINSTITVNLIATKGSIALNSLLGVLDLIFPIVNSQAYSISYFNSSVTLIGGLLHGVATSQGTNEDLIRVALTISKATAKSTQERPAFQTLEKVTAAIPG